MEAREHIQTNLRLLRESLDSGSMRSARLLIHSLHPSELARLLESLPLRQRAVIWEMVEPELEGDVKTPTKNRFGRSLAVLRDCG